MKPWRITSAQFTALARGGGGPSAVRALRLARRSRTLLLIRFIAGSSAEAWPAYSVLTEVGRVAPEALGRVVDHPSVGAWATRTALALRRGEPVRANELAFTAAAAALRADLDVSLTFPPVPVFSLPSLGIVTGPGLAYTPLPEITLGPLTWQLDQWQGGGLPPGLPVADSVDLIRWQNSLADAWDILSREHSAVAAELAEAVSVVTPMPSSPSGTSSATLADAFGCVFLSLAPDSETVAVTLAHEAAHTKLVALMDLFALVEPDQRAVFYAPWREDPRPVAGLLHGTYAHLAVAAFWRTRPGLRAATEYARWRTGALTAADTLLTSGKLTPLGHTFVTGMADVLRGWSADPVPPAALAAAASEAEAHRSRWLAAHTPT